MREIKNIAILGGGLLGGSIALAAADHAQVRIWARRSETVRGAVAMGLNATTELSNVVADAELVILCVPVGAMADLLKKAIDAGLPVDCLITDVGSVKRMPHEALREVVGGAGMNFIGSHPMAGGEKGGIDQARADLFHHAACLLTNDDDVASDQAILLEHFWNRLGCRTSWLTAQEHDEIVARVSHFPHLLAAVGAIVALKNPDSAAFGGGGLRDTTRVAAGNPEMWAEILCENRHAILPPLRESIKEMREMLEILESADHERAREWLIEAKRRRDLISSPISR
jgi:prephenate dehydrogenase